MLSSLDESAVYFHLQDGSQRTSLGLGAAFLRRCGWAGLRGRPATSAGVARRPGSTWMAGASMCPLLSRTLSSEPRFYHWSLECPCSLIPLFLSLKVIKMTQNVSKGGAGQDGDCRSVVELYLFSPVKVAEREWSRRDSVAGPPQLGIWGGGKSVNRIPSLLEKYPQQFRVC